MLKFVTNTLEGCAAMALLFAFLFGVVAACQWLSEHGPAWSPYLFVFILISAIAGNTA